MSSLTFLVELQMAAAELWENITGAWLVAMVSTEVLWLEWLRSMIIPSRFISLITVFPNGVSPLWMGPEPRGMSAAEQSALKTNAQNSVVVFTFKPFILGHFRKNSIW